MIWANDGVCCLIGCRKKVRHWAQLVSQNILGFLISVNPSNDINTAIIDILFIYIYNIHEPTRFQSSTLFFQQKTAQLGRPYLVGGFKYFLFSPLLGGMIQFDGHIFQMGWNHQLVMFKSTTRDASDVRGSPSGRRLQRYPLASATWRVKRRCYVHDRLCGEWLVYIMIFIYIHMYTCKYVHIHLYIYMGSWLYYPILQWFVTYTPFCHFWKNCYVLNSLSPEEIAGSYVSKSKMPS